MEKNIIPLSLVQFSKKIREFIFYILQSAGKNIDAVVNRHVKLQKERVERMATYVAEIGELLKQQRAEIEKLKNQKNK